MLYIQLYNNLDLYYPEIGFVKPPQHNYNLKIVVLYLWLPLR